MPRPTFSLLAIALCSFVIPNAPGQDAPHNLKITLGAKNVEAGLRVPSAGDGINAPETVGGLSARRALPPAGHFMYVAVDWPDTAAHSGDVYVTVDAYDDRFHELRLVYDKDAPDQAAPTKYAPAKQVAVLTGGGGWRKTCFFLPALRFEHGENLGADFRLVTEGVAVHEITVSSRKPDGFDPDAPLDAESARAIHVERPAAGMEVTFGNEVTPARAAMFKAMGATSVENYVEWALAEPVENEWNWSKWDAQVANIRAAGLKWVPLLIVGPAYATPLWYQNGPHSQFYRCLEHGEDTRIQSIFDPELRAAVERYLHAFAQHYGDKGVLESVLLGPTGIFGESIYPAAGPGAAGGGWTAKVTGPYHIHIGWWAGDKYAVAAFRRAMQKSYADIAALDAAWSTRYASFDEVTTFLPDRAPSVRARADFVTWYQAAMTEWARFWAETARKALPDTEIYLCTGGNGDPVLGADFTAQAAAIAPYNVGIRITNQANDYRKNFTITREVATATKFYGTFCGFEPAGQLDAKGPAACIYNAVSAGARAIYFYDHDIINSLPNLKNFRANAPFLATRHPQTNVAFYLSHESWAVDSKEVAAFHADSYALRSFVDHDYVTRRSINDGILKNYRVLVLADSPVLEPAAAASIERWVEDGGTLIAIARKDTTIGGRLYDNGAWRDRLFARASAGEGGGRSRLMRVKRGSTALIEDDEHSPRLAQAVSALLEQSPAQVSGVKNRASAAGGADGQINTKTQAGALFFDAAAGKIWGQ